MIGDSVPVNRRVPLIVTIMTISNIEEKLYPTYIALSPQLVLARNLDIIEKYGMNNYLTRREFKRAREMYQTAVYALGMTARTRDYYWVTPGNDNTPDCYLIWKYENGLCVECVEITLWNEHVDEMWEIIKKKIDKQYPFHFSIVIHDSNGGKNVASQYYQDLHDKLKGCSISAGAVRFWMEITNKGEKNVLIRELYPENTWAEFSAAHIVSSYSLSPQAFKADVISKPGRVTFEYDDLQGVALPPLPELNIKQKKR